MAEQLDYSKYYDLEKYLFEDINKHFNENGHLDAFDFFCIVIWKANRAKSKIAKLLLRKESDLNHACKALTNEIYLAKEDSQKIKILLIDWDFRLPMASAILTVLYPDKFTVYDYRVCEEICQFKGIVNKIKPLQIKSYLDFVTEIKKQSLNRTMRDTDRYLWGKSFYIALNEGITNEFKTK